MATWITHMRIAQNLINDGYVPNDYITEFLEGSVAPDCGYGEKDSFGDFNPPPKVTHWAPDGTKVFCDYHEFYKEYLMDKPKDKKYYFYFGYYIHLICDTLWSTMIYLPTKLKYKAEYAQNPLFLNTIKKDWYDNDFKFLQENEGFKPYKVLCEIDTVDDYLPYYEEGQLTVQIKYIADYYKDYKNHKTDRDYPYLTFNEISEFLEVATELVKFKI